MKRVVQPQMPSVEVDGYGIQQVYTPDQDDDSPWNKKKHEPRGCLSYIVLLVLFASGLYGMAAMTGSPIADSAAAAARLKFQSFQVPGTAQVTNIVSAAHMPFQHEPVATATTSNQPPAEVSPPIVPEPVTKDIDPIPVVPLSPPQPSTEEQLEELYNQVKEQEEKVRKIKQKGTVMEEDEQAKIETAKLQGLCRRYVPLKYGPGPHFLKFDLVFPDSMPDFATAGSEGSIVVQMGPVEHVPYSVFFFLEVAGEKWQGGAFHRPAGHVLQALVRGQSKPLAFQEYSPHFPHIQYTLGYAGRPGGPAFYISTVDNVANHGPGSQGSRTEADGCWGRLAGGEATLQTVKRMQKQPGGKKPSMFVSTENFIRIPAVTLIKNPSPDQKELVLPAPQKLRGNA